MQATHTLRGAGEEKMAALDRGPCSQRSDLLSGRDRHLVKGRGLARFAVHLQRQVQSLSRFHQGVPSGVPGSPISDHGTRPEAFGLGPRELFCTQRCLSCSVGQVQANSDGLGFQIVVEANHAFHLVVNLTGVVRDRNRARFMEARCRFDKDDRFDGWRVAKFNRMFCKGPDGAPHGHEPATRPHPIKGAMPNNERATPREESMGNEWSVRKRRPVRRKNIAPLLKRLEADLALDLNVDGAFLEMAEYGPWTMVFVDRVPLVVEVPSENDERFVFLTLRGFLTHLDALKWVEVDHGAIPFLMNGADCMVAGVHGAEDSVVKGDLVWIRDMTHKRPLALGWALSDAEELVESTKGKGIKTVHWVGDELWEME